MANRMALLVGFLVSVILILVVVVVFSFWVKPTFDGYVIEKQVDAQNLILNNIIVQAARCQQVSLPFGNQTINLIAVECLQQTVQQQVQQIQQPAQ